MDADIPFFAMGYCFLIITVGSLFLIQLILAVIIHSFIRMEKEDIENALMALNDYEIADQNEDF